MPTENTNFRENTSQNTHEKEILNLKLREAITNGNEVEIDNLLIQGAFLDAANDYALKALINVFKNRKTALLKKLLKSTINLHNANEQRLMNAFIANSGKEHFEQMKILFDAGINMNCQDNNGMTVLMFASHSDNYKLAKVFLDAGADVNLQSDKGKTALMFAVCNEYGKHSESLLQSLLIAGANVNIKDDDGKTALIHAAQSGSESWRNGSNTLAETIKSLLTAKADASIQDKDGKTALMYAQEKDREDSIIRLLMQQEK
jgi:ankyrin repeat protein